MKHTLIFSMLAAALMSSGVANAETLYASDYTSNTTITLGSGEQYDELVVDTPLTLTGGNGYLDLYNGASIEFTLNASNETICSISSSVERSWNYPSVYFNSENSVFNFTFDEGAQGIIAASAGTPITLIKDLNESSVGFSFYHITSAQTTLQLKGKGVGETVEMNGVQFTYVGPKADDYTFQKGEIGFKGYAEGSHALILEHGGGIPTPEPTTGSLSLLALAGLAVRRRRK